MAEFLLNSNDVAYTTKVGGRGFEPNKNGVKLEDTSESNFAFKVAIKGFKPEYPKSRVAQAIPNRALKEKYIEKTFYVTVPLKAQRSDLDIFLQKISDFQVSFKEDVGYSVKAIAKLRKGDSISYRSKDGAFSLEFGDKAGGTFEFKGAESKGNIEAVVLKRVMIKAKKQFGENKGARTDSMGNKFSFFESPMLDDVESVVSDAIKGEVRTICRGDRFKITIKDVVRNSMKEGSVEGTYYCDILCNFIES